MRAVWNPYPDLWLTNPSISGVDFDVDEAATPYSVEAMWMAAAGGGVLEGDLAWSLSP